MSLCQFEAHVMILLLEIFLNTAKLQHIGLSWPCLIQSQGALLAKGLLSSILSLFPLVAKIHELRLTWLSWDCINPEERRQKLDQEVVL